MRCECDGHRRIVSYLQSFPAPVREGSPFVPARSSWDDQHPPRPREELVESFGLYRNVCMLKVELLVIDPNDTTDSICLAANGPCHAGRTRFLSDIDHHRRQCDRNH
jgi:hypothetical protein